MEITIKTTYSDRVNVSDFDDGVWLSIQVSGGSAYTTLTKEQAKELLEALQTVIDHEVV